MLNVLLEVLLPIVLVAGIGFGLRRALPLDQATLNRTVIYGLNPALIFVSLVRADLSGDGALRMVALAVGVVFGMALLTLLIMAPLGVRGGTLSAMLLATLFMNSGNYGLPAARFAFGEDGFTQAVFYFVVQSILGQTLGVAVAAGGGLAGQTNLLREVTLRVLRMPQIYAVLAAFLVRWSGFDPATATGAASGLWRGITLVGEATLPMMLIVLGLQLGTGVQFEAPGLIAITTVLRLVVSPIMAYGLGLALGLSGVSLAVGVMLSGMPTAVHTTITALEFNSRPSLVVGVVVASSVASLATLSVLLTLLAG
jgi:predicted permease